MRERERDGHHLPAPIAFVVERYISPSAVEALASSVDRLARLCAEGDSDVRYLHSAYIAADDTCFCLFTATSGDAVRAINHRARFALHRISAATILLAASEPPDSRRDP